MSRWVCLRCYESNDDGLIACKACGLLRGATPAARDEGWQPAERPRGRLAAALPMLLRFWPVVLVLVVSGVGFFVNAHRGSEGEVTHAGNMSIGELRVGDCFDLKDVNAEESTEVDARPCSEQHQFEMLHIGSAPDGEYPDDAGWADYLQADCLPAFEEYLGISYESSRYDIFWFQPTTDGWAQGDRTVQCAVYDPMQSQLTSSLRGVAR